MPQALHSIVTNSACFCMLPEYALSRKNNITKLCSNETSVKTGVVMPGNEINVTTDWRSVMNNLLRKNADRSKNQMSLVRSNRSSYEFAHQKHVRSYCSRYSLMLRIDLQFAWRLTDLIFGGAIRPMQNEIPLPVPLLRWLLRNCWYSAVQD